MDQREQKYRALIGRAQQEADRAIADYDKQAWRRIAEGWQRLLDSITPRPQPQQQPQQKLEDDE